MEKKIKELEDMLQYNYSLTPSEYYEIKENLKYLKGKVKNWK